MVESCEIGVVVVMVELVVIAGEMSEKGGQEEGVAAAVKTESDACFVDVVPVAQVAVVSIVGGPRVLLFLRRNILLDPHPHLK